MEFYAPSHSIPLLDYLLVVSSQTWLFAIATQKRSFVLFCAPLRSCVATPGFAHNPQPHPSRQTPLDFGPFRVCFGPFRVRSGPFRVCFRSVSGPFRSVGWGRGGVGERGFWKGNDYHYPKCQRAHKLFWCMCTMQKRVALGQNNVAMVQETPGGPLFQTVETPFAPTPDHFGQF